jgi:hypothetical protein
MEAVLAAQGGGALCSDVIVTDDLASGALVKPLISRLPDLDTIRSMPTITAPSHH